MNAVQCDYCGKFAPNPGGLKWDRRVLPETWMFVATEPGGDRMSQGAGEVGEFCSRECVSKHFDRPK